MRTRFLMIAAAFVPAVSLAQAPSARPQPTIVPQPDTKLPLKHTPEPTSANITAQDLMTRLYIFADDSMQGREAGTIGNFKGTSYIASEVQKLGLKPMGDNGTYFQAIPLKNRTVDPTSVVAINGTPLAFGTEWVPNGAVTASLQNLPVVYGGAIGDSAHMIDSASAAGKFVVYALPQAALRSLRRVRLAPSAAAVAIIAPEQFMNFGRRPSQFVDDPSLTAGRPTPHPTVLITSAAASKLFTGNVDALTAGAAGVGTASLDIRYKVTPVDYPPRNVVAVLPGRDPKLAGEYVAIGAHNDHIGFNNRPVDHDSLRIFNHIVRPGGAENGNAQASPEQQAQVNQLLAQYRAAHPGTMRLDSIANGADDDGSGSVSVLEIAQKFASLKGDARPKRSILFVWHVGEEKGLLGSTYFTDHPTVPRDSIVAQLNMDMVGRGDAWDVTGEDKAGNYLHGNPNYLQIVGSRRLSTELGDLIEQVNTQDKHGLQFDYSMDANGHPQNIYCRSDHYEYARYGIPIAFFTTGGHSDYHQVTDEPEYIDYDHMARVDNLVFDVAMHVADMDHAPVVDHPKPDPRGVCQQ